MFSKQLAWFNTRLLSNHASLYKNPYLTSEIIPEFSYHKLQWHIAMEKLTRSGVCFVDQTNTSLNYGDGLDLCRSFSQLKNMPTIGNPDSGKIIDQEFESATSQRVNELYAQAADHNINEIRISWSGGIDSTFVLAAILQHPKSASWLKNNQISVYTTSYAKKEDPETWAWLMNSNISVRYLDFNALVNDESNWMLVTGEGEPYGTAFSDLHRNYVDNKDLKWGHWSIMESCFLEKEPSGLAWDYFRSLLCSSPIKIETCYHAWWYFENSVESQCFMYRLAAWNLNPTIDPKIVYPGSKIFWFMASQHFADHGSHLIVNRLIPQDPTMVKKHMQEYTAKFFNNLRPKIRFKSQWLVPRRIYKWKIYNDLSWDSLGNISEF